MVMNKEEIRYFCNPLFDGRIMVVAIGTLDDVYNLNSKLPRWTFCYTKEYFDTIPDNKIVWYQQELSFD